MSKKKASVEYDLFTDFPNVDKENLVVGAVNQAAEESQNQESVKKISANRRFWRKNWRSAKRFVCSLLRFDKSSDRKRN